MTTATTTPKPGPRPGGTEIVKPQAPVLSNITTEFEQISPDKAREYLNHMAHNRYLREATVNAYAADMAAGIWQVNGETVIFNSLGELTDGQHRLAAIVKSGLTLPMLVVRGVAPEAMSTIDVGRRRTVGNVLAMEGWANSAVAASVARLTLIYDLENFSAASVNSISSPQVYEYAVHHGEAIARAAHRATQLAAHVPAQHSVIGTAYYLFWRVDIEACESFFNAMVNMRTDGEGDPRLALMRRLTTIDVDRTRVSQLHALDLFLRAWNAWREKKSLDKIPLAKTPQWRKVL